jgi:predicted flap endonuclease-1-like 5' DNA nuclease
VIGGEHVPYTLTRGLLWFALALLLGIAIGYLLRSITARREVARARAATADEIEMERLRGRVANLEPVLAERDRLRALLEAANVKVPQRAVAEDPNAPPAPDVAAGSEILGRPLVLDDLTVVEGIGPQIEWLCHGIGIRTWWDLATTEVSLLRTMLDDAGSRFQIADPTTWPEQARMLSEGRWEEFRELSESVRATRRGA